MLNKLSENPSSKSLPKFPNLNQTPTVSSTFPSITAIMFLLQNFNKLRFSRCLSNLKRKIKPKLLKFTLCHYNQNTKNMRKNLNKMPRKGSPQTSSKRWIFWKRKSLFFQKQTNPMRKNIQRIKLQKHKCLKDNQSNKILEKTNLSVINDWSTDQHTSKPYNNEQERKNQILSSHKGHNIPPECFQRKTLNWVKKEKTKVSPNFNMDSEDFSHFLLKCHKKLNP